MSNEDSIQGPVMKQETIKQEPVMKQETIKQKPVMEQETIKQEPDIKQDMIEQEPDLQNWIFSCCDDARRCKSELLSVKSESGYCDVCKGYNSGQRPTDQNMSEYYLVGGEEQSTSETVPDISDISTSDSY